MPKLTLLLAFHNHQPDGNFDHVFQMGYDECYRPLLDTLAEFPRVRCALHHTGPLLEWLDKRQPGYLNDLRSLVMRGQVEILGGGFYEPMLAVLPDEDAGGQLAMMSQFCEERFGKAPSGMWLAERVWEPALAERIARAGLKYTLIDDTHFRYAGVSGPLQGYYVTEKAGYPLAIFPIEKELRYAIPFMPVDQTMSVLDGLVSRAGTDITCTYGDDGEKFGMWPGTKEWVWQKGWLREFLRRLSDAERIVTSTFSEAISRMPPTDRVYLPTASYEEMGEWALPASTQERYRAVRARLEEEGRFEEIRPFFRGGFWQSFMAKYPEANLMHKKMVHVSRKLSQATSRGQAAQAELEEARRELYRAQCNCAYWHGLFGGLYLNYLRHAVYSHLIFAEAEVDKVLASGETDAHEARAEALDFDADLRPEVILASSELWVGIKPDTGGAFFELDVRKKRFNLANVLGRHPEGYHAKLREMASHHHGPPGNTGGPQSIHDLVVAKESGLDELLHYDRHLRLGLVDHFLPVETKIDLLARSSHDERGDFATGPYEVLSLRSGQEASCDLRRRGSVRDNCGRSRNVEVQKTYSLGQSRLTCQYRVTLQDEHGHLPILLAPEMSLTLLAGADPGRRFHVPGRPLTAQEATMRSRGALEQVDLIELVDEWSQMRVGLRTSSALGAPTIWRFPLETVSQSESGFERTYQGSVIAPTWVLDLVPGEAVLLQVSIDVSEL